MSGKPAARKFEIGVSFWNLCSIPTNLIKHSFGRIEKPAI